MLISGLRHSPVSFGVFFFISQKCFGPSVKYMALALHGVKNLHTRCESPVRGEEVGLIIDLDYIWGPQRHPAAQTSTLLIYSLYVQALGLLLSPLPHLILIHRHLQSTSTRPVTLHSLWPFPKNSLLPWICCHLLFSSVMVYEEKQEMERTTKKDFEHFIWSFIVMYLQNSHWISLRKWKSKKGTIANIRKLGLSHTYSRPSYSCCFGQLSFVDNTAMQKKREGTPSSSFQVPTSLKHHLLDHHRLVRKEL